MHIIKASRTGNTLSLAIPVVFRKELSIDRTTYFLVTTPNNDTVVYTKLTAASLNTIKQPKAKAKSHVKSK